VCNGKLAFIFGKSNMARKNIQTFTLLNRLKLNRRKLNRPCLKSRSKTIPDIQSNFFAFKWVFFILRITKQ